MTTRELIAAAGRARIKDVPGHGFLIDDQPADTDTSAVLTCLVEDGLLMQAAEDPTGWSLLLPTLAATPLIVSKEHLQ